MVPLLIFFWVFGLSTNGAKAIVELPILPDRSFALLDGEIALKSQLGGWGVKLGPIDLELSLGPVVGVQDTGKAQGGEGNGKSLFEGLFSSRKGTHQGKKRLDISLYPSDQDERNRLVVSAQEEDYTNAYTQKSSDITSMRSVTEELRDRNEAHRSYMRERLLSSLDLGLGAKMSLGDSLGLGIGLNIGKGWGGAENVAKGERGDTEWYTYISVANPPQSLPILPDTGSSDTFVYSSTCSSCPLSDHPSFNASRSTTFQNLSTDFYLGYADGSTSSGHLATDILSFGDLNVLSTKMVIGLAEDMSGSMRRSSRSGIMGLGHPPMSTFTNGTTLFASLAQNGQLERKVLSMRLNKGKKKDGVVVQEGGGAYVFGGIEGQYIRGGEWGLNWIKTTSLNYWGFPFEDVTLGTKSAIMNDKVTPRRAIVDSGVSRVEATIDTSIHASLDGSKMAKSGVWYIPCNTSTLAGKNLFFKIKGVRYGVPVEDLAWKASGVYPGLCISGVQGSMPHFTVLGDIFIKNKYVVFSYEDDVPTVGLGERVDVPLIL